MPRIRSIVWTLVLTPWLARGAHASPDSAEALEPSLLQRSELWGNPYGGYRQRVVYTGIASAGLTADLDAAGWSPGTSLTAQGLWIQGRNFSPGLLGDAGIISNIAGEATARLFTWSLRQRFADGAIDLELGQLAIDNDFMVLESALLFVNSGFGTLQTEALNVPAPIYPLGALGTRLSLAPTESWQMLFGAYDADAGSESEHPHIADLSIGADSGAILFGEVTWHDRLDGRATRLSLGSFYHAGSVRNYEADRDARGLIGPYVMIEHTLTRVAGSELVAFSHGASGVPQAHAVVGAYFDAGLVAGGAAWGRPGDRLGLGLASTHFASAYLRRTRREGTPVTGVERVLELTYESVFFPWLALQPTVQWVFDPHFSRADALALGLRATVGQ